MPISLPALMQAQKISKRTAKVGFDWQTTSDVWDKVHEEVGEFKTEPSGSECAFEEVSDVLFSLANVARKEHIDAEAALAFANRQFRSRWASMERAAKVSDKPLDACSAEELDQLWRSAKQEEHEQSQRQNS